LPPVWFFHKALREKMNITILLSAS
jgi:hypothetical protein